MTKKTHNIMQDSIQDYINYCHTVERALELACHYIVKTGESPCACPIYRSGTKCELLDKGVVATCTQCWQEEFLKRALEGAAGEPTK